jgi:hypothetical protein
MSKLTNGILWALGLLGTYMITEGLVTGEELSNIQNVIGLALGGSAISIGMVISILRALPKQLVSAGYSKAVDKYGQGTVDNFVGKIDDVMQMQSDNQVLLNEVKGLLVEAQEVRNNLLSE